jgi:hypothetical protein
MSEIIEWQGNKVNVQARLVPRYLWNTASIDVFLDGQCILQTGGQLKLNGSHSATFTHSGSPHTAELSWSSSGLSFSFPYQLRIDGVPVAASRVNVQNWPIGLIVTFLVVATVFAIIRFVKAH